MMKVDRSSMPPSQVLDTEASEPRVSPVAVVWGALVVFLVGLILAKALVGDRLTPAAPKGLPVYGTIPDFELVESGGEPFTLAELKGKVWVASLFFTHCAATCPMMASQLARFQETVDNAEVVLVSISVDPERDTPERLREYAQIANAKPGRWFFLTGDKDTIVELAESHLKLGTGQEKEDFSTPQDLRTVSKDSSEPARETSEDEGEDSWELETPLSIPGLSAGPVENPILHSDRFALVDRQGRIRGYYDGLSPQEVDQLRADAGRLLLEGAR